MIDADEKFKNACAAGDIVLQRKKSNTSYTGGDAYAVHAGQIHGHGAHRPEGADRDPEGGARYVRPRAGRFAHSADRERGIALQSSSYYDRFVRAVFDQGAKAAAPDVPEAETQVFAAALAQELKREDGQ